MKNVTKLVVLSFFFKYSEVEWKTTCDRNTAWF